MESKICNRCKLDIPTTMFHKQKKGYLGVQGRCKECIAEVELEFRLTKKGVVSTIYDNQLSSSVKRGHNKPSYSRSDLKDWLYSDKEFHRLFSTWESSNYDMLLKPSVDRQDNDLPYSFSNIQLITWGENKALYKEDVKSGKVQRQSKLVLQIDKDTKEVIMEFHSLIEAQRQTGCDRTSISRCCNGVKNYKTTGGFMWKYKEDV